MPLLVTGAWIGAGLLVLAGVAKVRRPGTTARTLLLAGLPADRRAVRALGVGELAVATAGLTLGGVAWAPQAALYGAFTLFVVRQRSGPIAGCGCFGEEEVPVTGMHVGVDLLLAVAAGVAAIAGAPGLLDVGLAGVGWVAVPLAILATVVVRMLLVDLPVLVDAMRTAEAAA